jgi:LuxR family maltose regulon positive regulatory protein
MGNQLDAAEQHLRAGMERALGGLTTNASFFRSGSIALARLQQARNDPAGAHATLERLAELGRQRGFDPLVLAQGRAAQARLWLAQGELDAAIGWAETSGLRADERLGFPREQEQLTLARVLIARGRADRSDVALHDALALLGRLLAAAEAGERTGGAIEILTLRALALQACGHTAGAQAALERSLSLAAPEGYLRLFLDEGAPMRALLRVAARLGVNGPYAARLLDAFALEPAANGSEERLSPWVRGASAERQGAPAAAPPTPVAQLVERLSERELEVLRLVGAGHSNQAIADTLIVAVGTVKKHINNIYAKLEVGSRTQALARARALQLL